MTVADRLASLALVIADLNLRLDQAQQLAAQEKKRADKLQARVAELEAPLQTPTVDD